jgi:hypothetical protein
VQTETTVFSWFKLNRRREIRQDRKHLEARARRLLKSYLSADAPQKQRYYEVIAGAAAACQPGVSDPNLENPHSITPPQKLLLRSLRGVSAKQLRTTIN